MKLLEVHLFDSGFFPQLATGTFFNGLVNAHESTGEGPHAKKRLHTPLNQKHMECAPVETEHHAVGRNGGVRVVILIWFLSVEKIHYAVMCNFYTAKIKCIFYTTKYFCVFFTQKK